MSSEEKHIDMPPLQEEVDNSQGVTDTPPEPNTSENEPEAPQDQKPEKEELSQKEINLRELRRSKEQAERERDELRKQIEEWKGKEQAAPEEEFNLRDDDIPEWRHVNAHIKKIEKKLAQYEQQSTLQTTESKLKAQYPDFDSVVSADNIAHLREKYPEVAATLAASNDVYAKAVSAYTMIKRLGIGRDTQYDEAKEKANKNASKPRPLASVSPQQGESPLSRANAFAEGLTDELKEQLRKEMQESMKYR